MIEYKSNLSVFLAQLERNKTSAYQSMGSIGVRYIKKESPVRTGDLRDGNNFYVEDDLWFFNDVEYASHVELGTMYQRANPFMRRGIVRGTPELTKEVIRKLKV